MKIVFILIGTAVPENVGAAARAMKTMGFTEMRLVRPCDYLSGPARWLAHASNDILENAKVFDSLENALKDIDFAIATSAKTRHVKADYYPLDDLTEIIRNKGNTISKTAIVFGCEESGLTNEEISLCDIVSSVPMKNLYPSLNLAQSVMLYAYGLSGLGLKSPEEKNDKNPETYKALKVRAGKALEKLGFNPESNIYNRFIERFAILSENDMHLIHSICNKILDD
ncbi:MAG: tRNA/rRNA methyltransferase [Bacteroidota bacterium]|nr:tRNA/rRNA methyltransferase [Bacteroidota bacterium]